MYIIQDREAGNIIELVNTLDEANATISHYEEQDRKEDTYTEDFYEIVKADLSLIRRARNMSQSQLAEASGVSYRMIQYYEQGVKDINKAQGLTLQALANALECSIEDLLETT